MVKMGEWIDYNMLISEIGMHRVIAKCTYEDLNVTIKNKK